MIVRIVKQFLSVVLVALTLFGTVNMLAGVVSAEDDATYTLSFVYHDPTETDSGNGRIEAVKVPKGEAIGDRMPAEPVVEGLDFLYWQSNGVIIDSSYVPTKDIVVSPVYDSYLLQFVYPNPTAENPDNGKWVDVEVPKGLAIGDRMPKELPVKDGEYFLYWVSGGKEVNEKTVPEKNMVVAPYWCEHSDVQMIEGTPATCTKDGKSDGKKCAVCGKVLTEQKTIPAEGHQYADTWSYDENGHWHTCTVCGEKDNVVAHTAGDAATEDKDQTCTECGYTITPAIGHQCANHLTRVEAKAATCTEDGNDAYYRCSCGKLYADDQAKEAIEADDVVVPATGHTPAKAWESDETSHWHNCTVCGEKCETAVHTPGDPATEEAPQLCTECGYQLAEALKHNCADSLVLIPAQEASCTKEGNISYYLCTCGRLYADAKATEELKADDVIVPATGNHNFGEWVTVKEATASEEGVAQRTCANCGVSEEKAIPKTNGTAAPSGTNTSSGTTANGSGRTNDAGNTATSPKTGVAGMAFWAFMLVLSGASVIGAFKKRNRI